MVQTIRREVDIAWLAGLIEGEGCIISRLYDASERQHRQLFVRVTITNNDARIIRKATEIFSALGIGYFYQLHMRRKQNHNTGIVVTVSGKGRVKKLLDAIMPHLSGKLEQAQAMKSIIERRQEMAHCYKRGNEICNDREIMALIALLKRLKHELPVNPSETKRRANYPLTW